MSGWSTCSGSASGGFWRSGCMPSSWRTTRRTLLEFRAADATRRRLADAGIELERVPDSEEARSEAVAYLVEESIDAGLRPSALREGKTGLAKLLADILNHFSRAAERLFGLNRDAIEFDLQALVDLAYGAAAIEMSSDWHSGPWAHDNFKMSRIKSGEGSNMEGWGIYTAAARKTGEWYLIGLTHKLATEGVGEDTVRYGEAPPEVTEHFWASDADTSRIQNHVWRKVFNQGGHVQRIRAGVRHGHAHAGGARRHRRGQQQLRRGADARVHRGRQGADVRGRLAGVGPAPVRGRVRRARVRAVHIAERRKRALPHKEAEEESEWHAVPPRPDRVGDRRGVERERGGRARRR